MVFCPEYYELPTLDQTLALLQINPYRKDKILDYLGTRGEIYFHESLVSAYFECHWPILILAKHFADLTTPTNHSSECKCGL